jgi:hypothetical protein
MLYIFQAVTPPIIRSSKLYMQNWVFSQTVTANVYDARAHELHTNDYKITVN